MITIPTNTENFYKKEEFFFLGLEKKFLKKDYMTLPCLLSLNDFYEPINTHLLDKVGILLNIYSHIFSFGAKNISDKKSIAFTFLTNTIKSLEHMESFLKSFDQKDNLEKPSLEEFKKHFFAKDSLFIKLGNDSIYDKECGYAMLEALSAHYSGTKIISLLTNISLQEVYNMTGTIDPLDQEAGIVCNSRGEQKEYDNQELAVLYGAYQKLTWQKATPYSAKNSLNLLRARMMIIKDIAFLERVLEEFNFTGDEEEEQSKIENNYIHNINLLKQGQTNISRRFK